MAVTMDTKQQEAFPLLVVTVIGIQDLADLPHYVAGLHGAGGLHTPGKSEGAGFAVFVFIFLIPRYIATTWKKDRPSRLAGRANLCVLESCLK